MSFERGSNSAGPSFRGNIVIGVYTQFYTGIIVSSHEFN